MTTPIETLKERANKAAKRLADLLRTPKRRAHWQRLREGNLGKKRSEATKEKMRKAWDKRRAKQKTKDTV